MKKKTFHCLLLAASLPAMAAAQSSSGPADPSTPGPAPAYRSAFAGYQSYTEDELRSWQEVNDEVRRIGGHAGYMRSNERSDGRDPRAQPPAVSGKPEREGGAPEAAGQHHGH